ncbi:conserved Plasmodium protein, unknown function [Plasmodium gallinaceum]|uniref:Uncharacterized protein n=1 Tax=Plasmodium gallinaceum TaxID=5849 RepID=A0A1J1GR78_PLAGA|nr:conserved Plasmodium protein, unknown function [Plasmodium gallinaceum]CRG94772.1 conserved Plasmodium protein, unknown function [Plasmodium gallinaceum]
MNENNKKKSNNEEKIRSIDIYFDSEETNVPINYSKDKYELQKEKINKKISEKYDKKEFSILNSFQKELNDKNEYMKKKEIEKNPRQKKNYVEENINLNNEEFEIPIQRRNTKNDYYNNNFYKNIEHDKEYEDDKKLHLLDIFNYNDFPINLFGKKKKKEKNKEKKFVIEFLDSYNDEFVKKNIDNNLIFESIGVCKGVSFLYIGKNININCIGSKDDNAFYFYKMIPFNKIYSKDAINKILSKKKVVSKKEDIRQSDIKNINSNIDHKNYFLNYYNILKNYFFKDKKKKTLYNDLYLSPYEKNLKSSVCIGTHIYSKERAVKKCFGLLIEQNVYNIDQPHDDNTTVNKNLENLYFDFPYDKHQIIFKPIYYPYKNIKIINNSLKNYLKSIHFEKLSHLKDSQFYYNAKKNIFDFSKDLYLTTKNAIKYFDSPKDFIIQTTKRMQDINIQIKKICEKSLYIIHDSILKLSKASKAS